MASASQTRGRQSRIDSAPEAVREEVHRLLMAGVPQKDILEALAPLCREHGIEPFSRSGLSRHAARMERVLGRMRSSRLFADALVRAVGQDPESRVSVLLGEMMRSMSFEWLESHWESLVDEEGAPDSGAMDVAKMSSIALMVRRLASAERESLELDRDRAEMRAEAARQAALEAGVDEDTSNLVRDILLGREAA